MQSDKQSKLALWGVLCFACTQGLAQSAMPALQGQRTLGELIDAIKVEREALLMPGPGPINAVPDLPRHGSPVDPQQQLPRLWSVTGMNGRFTAVLVVNGKVHTLNSDTLPTQVGGWRVSQIDPFAVLLSQQGRSLRLAAPHSASTAHGFVMDGGLK
jgi:hypothetical protein